MQMQSIGRNIRHSCRAAIGAAALVFTALPTRADFRLAGDANSKTSAVGDDDVITFTQSGTLTVTGSGSVDILLVGGGGGIIGIYMAHYAVIHFNSEVLTAF